MQKRLGKSFFSFFTATKKKRVIIFLGTRCLTGYSKFAADRNRGNAECRCNCTYCVTLKMVGRNTGVLRLLGKKKHWYNKISI